MKVLVAGATGATGHHVVKFLLEKGATVVAFARSKEKLVALVGNHDDLEVIEGTLLDMTNNQLRDAVRGCDGIVSCLGHNLTFKGIYGNPRKLVTDSVRRLCEASMAVNSGQTVKFALMNTTGVRNKALDEPRPFGERLVVGLLRVMLPPHPDNEGASAYLHNMIGVSNKDIEWVAVRPDTLIDEDRHSPYDLLLSPTRSPIFNAGKTSRINVAHFISELLANDSLWEEWKGRTPVIYNKEV